MSDIQKEYAPKGNFAVVGGTIDNTGMVALQDYVQRFHPEFPIGAMDPPNVPVFGQWGPRIAYVPQLFFIDRNGMVQAQFMGGETIFEGDKIGNLRAAINRLMGPAATKPAAAPAKKAASTKK